MSDVQAPLIATDDEHFLDDALRWCAAAGAVPDVACDPTAVRRLWRQASVVLVGEDLADSLVRAGLPRRDHVVLVVGDPSAWWPAAVTLGAASVCGIHQEQQILDALATGLDGPGEACLVSVVGAAGGVGASTFAVSLGLGAQSRGLRPLLVDIDPWGGGVELVLGAEQAVGLRWPDFSSTSGRISAGSLADVLPSHRGVSTLSWGRSDRLELQDVVSPVLTAALRGFDLVVADVPRQLGGPADDVVGRSVLTVLLVPEEIGAVAAAQRVLDGVQRKAPTVGLVTVHRAGGIGPSAVADALGIPSLARLRTDRRVRTAIDRGQGPGRSRRAARAAGAVLNALGLETS